MLLADQIFETDGLAVGIGAGAWVVLFLLAVTVQNRIYATNDKNEVLDQVEEIGAKIKSTDDVSLRVVVVDPV